MVKQHVGPSLTRREIRPCAGCKRDRYAMVTYSTWAPEGSFDRHCPLCYARWRVDECYRRLRAAERALELEEIRAKRVDERVRKESSR